MSKIHILDRQTDKIIDYYSNKKKLFWNDEHFSSLENYEEYFNFITLYDNSEHLTSRNRIIIPDEDGFFREFLVHETVKDGDALEVYSIASFADDLLKEKTIPPQTFEGETVNSFMDKVLEGTGWKRGKTDYLGIRSVPIENATYPFSVLKTGASTFKGELNFRLEVSGNKVTRFVDLIERQGKWNGKEITVGKDLIGVKRRETSEQIVTSLMCIGPERQDGTRLEITVMDEDARKRWGKLDPSGEPQHLWAVYEPQSSDQDMTAAELRSYGETELAKRINSVVEYEADQASIEHIFGFEHEKVRKGDTVRIKDTSYTPALYLEARVKSIKRSISDPSQKTYTLGDFIEFEEEDVMALFRSMQKVLAQKITEQQLLEKTYTKLEVDNKDQATYEDSTYYSDVQAQPGKDAKSKIDYEVGNGTLETTSGSQQKASTAETNAKGYALTEAQKAKQEAINSAALDATNKVNSLKTNLETSIADKADATWVNGQLVLKANASDVYGKAETYTRVEVDDALNSKVSVTTYTSDMNGVITDLESHETRITQTESDITTKVSNTIYQQDKSTIEGNISSLTSKMSTVETSISENAEQIALRATKTEVYTRTETDTKLSSKANQSSLDATNSNVSTLTTKISNFESELSVQADEIALRVTKTEFDNLQIGGRNFIGGSDFIVQATSSAFAPIKGFGLVSGLNLNEVFLGKTATFSYFVHSKGAKQDGSGSYGNRFGIHGTVVWGDSTGSKSNTTLYPFANYLTSYFENSRVHMTYKFDPPNGYDKLVSISFSFQPLARPAIGNPEIWKLGQPKLELGNKATDYSKAPEDTDSDISSLNSRVSSTESSIIQQATQIQSKVSATDYNGTNIVSKITQTATALDVLVQNINLTGKVTFSAFDSSTQTKVNNGDVAKSTLDSKASVWDAKETPSGAQTKANSALSSAKSYTDTLKNSLGSLAYDDLVEKSKLGTTVIQGGYLVTSLIQAGAISLTQIESTTQAKINNGNSAKSTLDSKASVWDAKETPSGAQSKADAAKNSAISTAASDATNKANNAEANAKKYAVPQEGIKTNNTSSGYANYWAKLVTVTTSSRYSYTDMDIKITGGASGSGSGRWAEIHFRVKQQNELGSEPYVAVDYVQGNSIQPSHFKAVTTSNTTSNTTVELWVQINTTYEQYAFTPYNVFGTQSITFNENGGLSQSLPSGTQESAVDKSHNPTTSTVNTNKSIWDRASNIRTDGKLDVTKLYGLLSDSQLASAAKWNKQGTYIDSTGVYTGVVVADQIVSGKLTSIEIEGVDITGVNIHGSQFRSSYTPEYTNYSGDMLLGGLLRFTSRHNSMPSSDYYITEYSDWSVRFSHITGGTNDESAYYTFIGIDSEYDFSIEAKSLYLYGATGVDISTGSGQLDIYGTTQIESSGSALKLKSTTTGNAVHHEYLNTSGSRMGFIGYGSSTNDDLYIRNELGSIIRVEASEVRMPNLVKLEGSAQGMGLSRFEFYNSGFGTRWGRIGYLGASDHILGIQNYMGEVRIYSDFSVSGSKAAVVDTESYGARKMYAIEAPDNRFAAYIEKELEVGEHIIFIEPMFLETISDFFVATHVQNGACVKVLARYSDSFRVLVSGYKADVVFEVNGKRRGFEDIYMEESTSPTQFKEENVA